MKIVFNMEECGLANNGGTRTILFCQQEMINSGHDVQILAKSDRFTWFNHPSIISKIPFGIDVMIATSCTTVDSTNNSNARAKIWYIRAHETWAMSESELSKRYKSGILNIVNSHGLKMFLKDKFDVDSQVIYQGIDLDKWIDRQNRKHDKIRIGCLHTRQSRKRWSDFVRLSEILGKEEYEYVSFGPETPRNTFLSQFIKNPSHDQLVNLYSSCHIWFAPTESEGLHNVPMEASLCGCLIVCSDAPLNGMVYDYAFKDTAMIYKNKDIGNAADLIRNADWTLIPKMQECIKNKIGSREDNMKKFIKHIESQIPKAKRVLAAGPWEGEFGWELFGWQPYLRFLITSGEYDEIIISSRESSRFLYNDFCSGFIPYNTNIKNCSFTSVCSLGDDKNQYFMRKEKAKKIFEKEFYTDILTPSQWKLEHNTNKSFISYGKCLEEFSYDVVIHARHISNVKRDMQSKTYRNWEKDKWLLLGQKLKNYGIKACSIGLPDASLHVDGTDDRRGCDLSVLSDILASSKLCVGPSSGPMHFASLCKCPHIVWTEPRNIVRYRKHWNPFKTPARLVLEGTRNGWSPSVDTVIDSILEELTLLGKGKFTFRPIQFVKAKKCLLDALQDNFTALDHYLSTLKDFLYVGDYLFTKGVCNFLMFSSDPKLEDFFRQCNAQGNNLFLRKKGKDNAILDDVIYLEFGTKRKQWQSLLNDPCKLKLDLPEKVLGTKWDIIFVDGPNGHLDDSPGRMKSIYASSILANKDTTIFLHDHKRKVEKIYSEKYLKIPSKIFNGVAAFNLEYKNETV